MTFIPVRRKHAPQPQDTEEEHLLEDQADDERDTSEDQDTPAGFLGALAAGVRGWLAWCSSRIGVRGTYGLHVLALWSAWHYSAWVTWAVTLTGACAVVTFVPREAIDRLVTRIERPRAKTTVDTPEQATAGQPADRLPHLVYRLIADAPGVHRKTLTEVLAQAAQKEGIEAPTEAQVEAALSALGIPLRPSVRDARGKVNRGVHRDDLEAWAKTSSPSPSHAPATGP
ncbi:hypothetical protein [Streptomyces sp. NPDC020489]|uniref:hypothetical protein n=1 Tax=Streptomyces sp. NPDC020489 TaxID=3365077 RepID=UPI0037BAF3DB